MKPDPTVLRETRRLFFGLLTVSAAINLLYALLGKWDYTVLTGAVLGTLAAVLNFFLLGLTVQKAAETQENPKKYAQLSYGLRMLLLMGLLVCGIVLPYFNTLATLLPVLLTTPVIYLLRAITARKE